MIKKLLKSKQAMIGLTLIVLVTLVALWAPLIAPHDPNKIDVLNRFMSASSQYPLGTDQLGRCVLSRLLIGASYSLGIAVPTLLVLGIVGLTLGTASAYVGMRWERVFLSICDIFMAFPALVIVLSLIGALGQGLLSILLAVAFSLWAWFAKVVWSYARMEISKDYILAAKIAGCSDRRIILYHIIPNIFPQFLVYLSTGIAGMIIMISGFSFLGLGFEAGTPEWGAMLNEARSNFYSHPELVFYPGLCVLITAAGFNLFGEALRDMISPEEVNE
ncbi:ABC transporter permease [Gracilibacillus alcaliphilus]|uniref:ABC transporter permease n=1 Tax=Gracilibacillus alcaliphilus TaxID=1401441 RepID=UPI0019572C93|nr:ABC transporter permease subunit [Gracilibacillus alcaliphilus]MBM7678748.1 peptide/nickel transport system permease protein [Gracilibacillus alcaliphilus]